MQKSECKILDTVKYSNHFARFLRLKKVLKNYKEVKQSSRIIAKNKKPFADGVVVIVISLFPEVPGSIHERDKKRRFLSIRLFACLFMRFNC